MNRGGQPGPFGINLAAPGGLRAAPGRGRGDLCGALAGHLVQRYGADEVTRRWAFEVWNEPNLDVFWSGTRQEYFRLYDVSARAVKSVHPGLRVGGPASGTLDQGKIAGDARLDREVRLRVRAGTSCTVRHYRIDAEHSNIVPAWEKLRDGAAWPRGGQWRALREQNTLDELVPPARVTGGLLELAFELPMPGVSYLELAP